MVGERERMPLSLKSLENPINTVSAYHLTSEPSKWPRQKRIYVYSVLSYVFRWNCKTFAKY